MGKRDRSGVKTVLRFIRFRRVSVDAGRYGTDIHKTRFIATVVTE